MMELCEFDFEPFNADKKVSSLDQFFSYMNKEDIFDYFSGIGNVIASDVVRAVSYLYRTDIVYRDIKPAKVLVCNSHYKSYKHEELEMALAKNLLSVNLVFWGKQDLCIHRLMLQLAKNAQPLFIGEA